jgi:hypothetical protein
LVTGISRFFYWLIERKGERIMAKGDLTIFEKFANDVGAGYYDLDGNTYKLALISTAAGSVAASTASPNYADFSGAEMASGNGYSTGGATVASTGYTEASGVGTLVGNSVTWSQNASGFTTARTAILYTTNSSPANTALCYVDLGSVAVSLADGDVTVSWHSSGVLTITVS